MPYCLYLRKSRADFEAEQQGMGETLARHETALRALALQCGYTISKTYREIQSGETIAARPQMQCLLADVAKGLWEGVLVMEVERLARGDTMDQGLLLHTFQQTSTKIITPYKTYDPNNPFDEEYFEFGLFMSRREYKTINRRMQQGRRASVQEGKYIGSIAPYGYIRQKLPHEKGYTLAIEPTESEIVRMIYEWYAFGIPQPDGSIKNAGRPAIAKHLIQLGIPTRKGGMWATSSITRILQNPVYCGKVFWTPQKQTAQNTKLLLDGKHTALVSETLWQMVQEKIAANGVPPAPRTLQNPLAGLIRCAYCNHTMQRRPYQKSGQTPFCICVTPHCPQVAAPLELIEDKLLAALQIWCKDHQPYWEEIANTLRMRAPRSDFSLALRSKKAEYTRLQTQIQNAYDLLEQGIYTPAVFTQRHSLLQEKLQIVSDEIETLSSSCQSTTQTPYTLPQESIWEIYPHLPPAQKNLLLKNLIQYVLYEKTSSGRWHHSPDAFTLTIFPKISNTF